jgi:hypothetical protein
MAYELIFKSTERSEAQTSLLLKANQFNEIYITIENDSNFSDGAHICLEKESAIKLAKEIRKQISLLEG